MSDFNGSDRPNENTAAAVKQAAQDRADEGAGLVREKTTDVVGTAKDHASDVAGEASTRARDVAGELRDQLQEQARTQTQRLAGTVRQLADDLGDMGESGRTDSPVTGAVRQMADRGRRLAGGLESRGPEGLVSDLQDFARRRPGAFLAGAALAGFAAARLSKGVKAAGSGAAAPADGARSDTWASAVSEDGLPGGTPDRLSDIPGPGSDGQSPTPSYGGSVAPDGPFLAAEPYPTRDSQEP